MQRCIFSFLASKCSESRPYVHVCPPLNNVLQAVLNWSKAPSSKLKTDEDSMLMSLAETFVAISSNKKKFGIYAPKKLIQVPTDELIIIPYAPVNVLARRIIFFV
jgi:hypothetical protein